MTESADRLLRALMPRARARAGRAGPPDVKALPWYRIQAAEERDEVWIYGEIGFWGITAADFVADLQPLSAPNLTLHLSSPGGDVYDGIAIYNALRKRKCTVRVEIDALAASIASVIAMAGDRIVMARNAEMMIHNPWTIALGDAREMREVADRLEAISENIADIYAQRAGGEVEDWTAAMDAETWYTGREALAAGLVDEVTDIDEDDDETSEAAASRFRPAASIGWQAVAEMYRRLPTGYGPADTTQNRPAPDRAGTGPPTPARQTPRRRTT